MIQFKIINGVRMSSETGHELKWDGVYYGQQIVTKQWITSTVDYICSGSNLWI